MIAEFHEHPDTLLTRDASAKKLTEHGYPVKAEDACDEGVARRRPSVSSLRSQAFVSLGRRSRLGDGRPEQTDRSTSKLRPA